MQWQYWENPIAPAHSWVWEAGSEIVCHYAAIPVPVVIAGKAGLGVLGVDAATAPGYREHNLFTQLAAEALDFKAASPVPMTIWFTAAGTHLPSIADTDSVPFELFALPLRNNWVSDRLRIPAVTSRVLMASLFRRPRASRALEINEPSPDIDELWCSVAARYNFSIRKDATWWAWRFRARPHSGYRYFEHRQGERLSGAAVAMLHAGDESLVYVLEMLATDPRSARALAAAIVDSFEGADAVVFRASPASYSCRIARSAGLLRVPRQLDSSPPRVAVLPHTEAWSDLARAPWSVTWGDMDHL